MKVTEKQVEGKGITAVKAATLSFLAYSSFYLFLHLQQHLAGQK